ncbi:MAG: hypothetical protein AMXMBFR64_36160 [Myxococcales bacterium]
MSERLVAATVALVLWSGCASDPADAAAGDTGADSSAPDSSGAGSDIGAVSDVPATDADSSEALIDAAADSAQDVGAADAAADTAPDTGPPWSPLPLVPSEAWSNRKAEYLAACHAASGPGSNAIYGQVCRVALGGDLDEAAIGAAITKLANREDTADFRLAALVRLLYLDDLHHTLPQALREEIEQSLLGFKYWLSEPGQDKMCYWSENHQILFHSGELLAGQLFPDEVFPNAGMTGADHVAHATPRVLTWLDRRLRFGFSEWHSNVYFNEDIPALVNLVDFAADEGIRTRAAMVLDTLALDLLGNTFKGHFATAHGRTYESKLVGALSDSTREAAWVMLGLGDAPSKTHFSASFLATSPNYFTPALLEDVAQAATGAFEHRQRDGIAVADGPAWGIGYTEPDDVVFWAGMAALAAPQVVNGTAALLDTYDLWQGFLFGDLPDSILGVLKTMKGTPQLVELVTEMEALSRGIALEAMSTYTWRTPHYQLSGAQEYNPGFWGAQTHVWQATLDGQAYVFTSVPGNLGDLAPGVELATSWVGGWMPRVTLHRNVGVIQYRHAPVDSFEKYLSLGYVHAWFPRGAFDEVREEPPWVFGRKGDAWVALAADQPTRWAEDNDHELIVDAVEVRWVVELGSADDGTFDEFVAAMIGSGLTFGAGVAWESPALGPVTVGWETRLRVGGADVDTGPYPRFSNVFVERALEDPVTVIEKDGVRLILDADAGTRTLWEAPE